MKQFNVLMIVLAAIVSACQPEPDNQRLLDELVVSTSYDESVQFNTYGSYALAVDTIGFISNRTRDTLLTHSESSLVRPILSSVRAQLDNRGFTRVARNEDPDLGVNVYIVNDLNLFQQVLYPSYYYPYYYGYNPGYYYGYPLIQTYAQNTGSLVIELVDLVNRTPDNKVKVIWIAYMGDVVSTIDREKQITEGINQAFLQSPYVDREL